MHLRVVGPIMGTSVSTSNFDQFRFNWYHMDRPRILLPSQRSQSMEVVISSSKITVEMQKLFPFFLSDPLGPPNCANDWTYYIVNSWAHNPISSEHINIVLLAPVPNKPCHLQLKHWCPIKKGEHVRPMNLTNFSQTNISCSGVQYSKIFSFLYLKRKGLHCTQ